MLYVQRGYSNKVMQAVPGTLKDYLARYNIPTFTVSADNVKDLKRKLDYAYSGMLTDNRRSNDTIQSRDILALGLDNINPSINTRQAFKWAYGAIRRLRIYPIPNN